MKRVLRSLALVAIAVVSFSAAKAQNPHFVAGSFVWNYGNGTVTASGKIVGLGNIDRMPVGDVKISQRWDVVYNCVNPGGQKPTPYQHVEATAEVSVVVTPDRNGVYSFGPETADVNIIISSLKQQWQDKFCPSKKWTIQIIGEPQPINRPSVTLNSQVVLD